MKKEQIIYKPDEKVFVVNGKKFKAKSEKIKKIDGIEHVDYEIWEEIDEEQYKKHLDIIKKKIIDEIPKEVIVDETLKKYSISAIKRMANQIEKKDVKVKRHYGCFGIKLDGGKYNSSYLDIFD